MKKRLIIFVIVLLLILGLIYHKYFYVPKYGSIFYRINPRVKTIIRARFEFFDYYAAKGHWYVYYKAPNGYLYSLETNLTRFDLTKENTSKYLNKDELLFLDKDGEVVKSSFVFKE